LMRVELGLVVVEDKQGALEVGLVNHPREITVTVSALECGLDYSDGHAAPFWLWLSVGVCRDFCLFFKLMGC
jgi:hypothetical protein